MRHNLFVAQTRRLLFEIKRLDGDGRADEFLHETQGEFAVANMRFDFELGFHIALFPRLVREEMLRIFIFCHRNLDVVFFL